MITIGDRSIELLRDDSNSLPEGQLSTYQMLSGLEGGTYSVKEISDRLNLRSSLPLWSRLQHLEAKGLIRISVLAKA